VVVKVEEKKKSITFKGRYSVPMSTPEAKDLILTCYSKKEKDGCHNRKIPQKKIILIVGILLGYTSVVNGTVSAPAGAD